MTRLLPGKTAAPDPAAVNLLRYACGEPNKRGTACGLRAGAGTDHLGWGPCALHGGATWTPPAIALEAMASREGALNAAAAIVEQLQRAQRERSLSPAPTITIGALLAQAATSTPHTRATRRPTPRAAIAVLPIIRRGYRLGVEAVDAIGGHRLVALRLFRVRRGADGEQVFVPVDDARFSIDAALVPALRDALQRALEHPPIDPAPATRTATTLLAGEQRSGR